MRRLAALPFAPSLLMVSAAFMVAAPAQASDSDFQAATPDGFEDLQADRQVLLDVYFGGEKVGAARATVRPGILSFDNPAEVARLLPDVASLADVTEALSAAMAANAALACGSDRQENCGRLQPPKVGVILDEDRFRVDVFINPSLLAVVDEQAASYLDGPDGQPSLVSLFGATISGSSRGDRAFHVQNRSVASIGALRLRSDSSLGNRSGLSFDNLTIEADRADWRYLGGLFWAPGSDLVGRRKIAGLGVTTQLDTRADKDSLSGTPLVVFLQQPGRVEILIDERLVSSRIYSAGQRLIDTSQLPNGSYEVVLRVQEDGRPARSERRFFTKGSLMAPPGRPLLSAFAGFLQASNRGASFEGDTLFYQASAAYRLTPLLGVDATFLGSQRKAVLESGALVSTRFALLRIAGLVSSAGDLGVVLRTSTVGQGPFALSFDLRKVSSRDGRPLLPVSSSNGTFSEDPEAGIGHRGTYTQGVATIGYRFRQAIMRLSGLYRKDGSQKAYYNLAASLEVPVVRTSHWDLRLEADVRKSEKEVSSFLGLRFLVTGQGMAVSGRTGIRHQSDGRSTGLVAETQAGWYRQLADHTQVSTDLAFGRDPDGGYARSSSYMRSPLVNVRADALRQWGGGAGTTQFAATADTGIALNSGGFGLGARDMNDAAAIVAVSGGGDGQSFEVLVDEVVRGTVSDGRSLVLFLPPYETYQVRLRSRDSQAASFETASRNATLFPGNVVDLHWEVTPLIVLFGRAVDFEGDPIASAEIRGPHGIGRTDEQGYFQIEASRDDRLAVDRRTAPECSFSVPEAETRDGYLAGGDMTCR